MLVLDSDGYFMGVSLAELLADRGKRVTLVTPFASAAPYTDWTLEGPNLRRMMREKGIGERLSHWVERVETGNALSRRACSISIAMAPAGPSASRRQPAAPRRHGRGSARLRQRRPVHRAPVERRALPRPQGARGRVGRARLGGVFRAGDCLAPRYLADAVFDGHRLAREFDDPDPERPRAIIRERPLWGIETYPKLDDRVL